jgi:hypothetical protein
VRAALFTNFPTRFVNDKIIPELTRRGVEVIFVDEPKRAGGYDLRAYALDVVFHMTELGGHSKAEPLVRACRDAGVAIRSLSRKKAMWRLPGAASSGSGSGAAFLGEHHDDDDAGYRRGT